MLAPSSPCLLAVAPHASLPAPANLLPLHSDHEIEHLTEPWLEMVVLDQLCEELSDNNIYILDPRPELARASSPASSMETPAPAEETRADAVADALEADALEADAPSSAESESEVEADADTVRPRAAAAWAAGLWPSGGAPATARLEAEPHERQ